MSTNVPAKAAPVPSVATEEPRKLDDVLLAMDVVDTLRHRERIVDMELNAEQRETQLIERLKQIYDAQGISVPERILKDGVMALEEQRFVYKPPPPSFNTKLAHLYVNRKRWLPGVTLAAVIAAAVLGAGWFTSRTEEAAWAKLPAEIARLASEDQALAIDPQVDASIAAIARAGQTAVDLKDRDVAEAQLNTLKDMNVQLASEYDVRIVSRPGEDTGFYRTPDDQPNGRNYYLVVEAVPPGGGLVEVAVRNEETQKTERVSQWAQRVSEGTFNKTAEDKRGDNIVQNDILGHKVRGELEAKFDAGVLSGAMTKW